MGYKRKKKKKPKEFLSTEKATPRMKILQGLAVNDFFMFLVMTSFACKSHY